MFVWHYIHNTQTHACAHTRADARTDAKTRMHARTRTQIYTVTHIHKYKHTHIYTNALTNLHFPLSLFIFLHQLSPLVFACIYLYLFLSSLHSPKLVLGSSLKGVIAIHLYFFLSECPVGITHYQRALGPLLKKAAFIGAGRGYRWLFPDRLFLPFSVSFHKSSNYCPHPVLPFFSSATGSR